WAHLARALRGFRASDHEARNAGGRGRFLVLRLLDTPAPQPGDRMLALRISPESLAMENRPFKAATAPPVARLPCHVSHCVSQHGLDAFGTLFKDFGRRPSCEEPPSSMHAAFIGIFLTRKGRSKGSFGHVYKAVKDENDMVSSGQELRDISTSFDSGDILGDGSVMKSIVEEGVDPAVFPVFGDDCVTHFVGTLPDGSIFNDTTKRDQPFKFRLGAEHVLEGFDEGVATMRKGERAIFQLSSEVAYGSFGARDERGWQVPPDTPVTFDIRLLDVIKAPANSATAQDPVPGYGREDLGSGGASPDGKYSWKRNGAEVLVMVPVADDVETKDVSYVFQEAYVCIAVCGATLLAGRPGCDVEAEECYWEFSSDSGRMRFSLGRLDGAFWRSSLGELILALVGLHRSLCRESSLRTTSSTAPRWQPDTAMTAISLFHAADQIRRQSRYVDTTRFASVGCGVQSASVFGNLP
ncbi:FKBP65, partial [Symbiodinium necroappetens]